MAEQKTVQYDIDGFDVVTTALRELINQYPALSSTDEIMFSVLGEDSGKAIFPISEAVIASETEDVTGHVVQICLYPFYVIYRAAGLSENRKAAVKEWLDDLGRWLNRQTIDVGGESYRLEEYPEITGDRKFLDFDRKLQTAADFDSINENNSENWKIKITARYQNEFDR